MQQEQESCLPSVRPYGAWRSPITAEFVTSQGIGLSEIQMDDDYLYWLEQRPSEQGRSVVVRCSPDGTLTDVFHAPFNARTRVHEYGGGCYRAISGAVYFSNFSDNALYVVQPGNEPRPITSGLKGYRFADFVFDSTRDRLVAVAELHQDDHNEPRNLLVGTELSGSCLDILAGGHDFYSSPRLSPDGSKIAWLTWDHPNMPWDGTKLWSASLQMDGTFGETLLAAGGVSESICQPMWSPDGILYYVSDRNGWWNIYRDADGLTEAVFVKDAEYGAPHWVFGQSHYAFADSRTIIASYTQKGIWHLESIDTISGRATEIETPFTVISNVVASSKRCCFVGASSVHLPSIISLDLSDGKYEVLQRSGKEVVAEKYLSTAEQIEFSTSDGRTAFGNFYQPKNDDFLAPEGELPPLLVACHGGPTSASYGQLNASVQYWTSRGFAFIQVNYSGSTGYGREYRESLNENWGIADVDDCINGALYLASVGRVDRARLTIHGGSAGGYTALCALTFHNVFAAGASLYGVSDLEALATETHKFESRYLDRLIGPYPASKDLYVQRSPIHFSDRISEPMIFFQGLDDKVVPPNQAETMFVALQNLGIPVAYITFEGEGHGFRKGESIKRCLDAHLYFYCKLFGIPITDKIEPVEIVGID
jgi:dipeptidyl aminopeptidase/acylaminoacyl peptidase